jgi:hypothetical protein
MSSISESRLVHNKLAKTYCEQVCAIITIQSILQIYNDELAANAEKVGGKVLLFNKMVEFMDGPVTHLISG